MPVGVPWPVSDVEITPLIPPLRPCFCVLPLPTTPHPPPPIAHRPVSVSLGPCLPSLSCSGCLCLFTFTLSTSVSSSLSSRSSGDPGQRLPSGDGPPPVVPVAGRCRSDHPHPVRPTPSTGRTRLRTCLGTSYGDRPPDGWGRVGHGYSGTVTSPGVTRVCCSLYSCRNDEERRDRHRCPGPLPDPVPLPAHPPTPDTPVVYDPRTSTAVDPCLLGL